eukprot:scaffold266423_cov33-Tisochrysis_lutea.AAC.2
MRGRCCGRAADQRYTPHTQSVTWIGWPRSRVPAVRPPNSSTLVASAPQYPPRAASWVGRGRGCLRPERSHLRSSSGNTDRSARPRWRGEGGRKMRGRPAHGR